MSLYKRKDSPNWWVKFVHGGRAVQQSTGTADKAKAREFHDKLKASLWEQDRLGIRPSYSWNEAVIRYVAESTHKASLCADKAQLRWLDRFLGGRWLQAIDRNLLEEITAARLAGGASHATVNRTLEVIRAVLRKAAFEWDWIDKVPKFR